jgi:hypothetical protein
MGKHQIAILFICGLSTSAIGVQPARCQDGTQSLILTQYAEPEVQADETVVGRQFPLSPSVRRECAPPSVMHHMCETLMSELAKFAGQPRDRTWASATERRLRTAVVQGSTEVIIRGLECRQSLCAIETATPAAVAGYKAVKHSLLAEDGLIRVQEVPAWETDENGARVVVMAEVILRRPTGPVAGDR